MQSLNALRPRRIAFPCAHRGGRQGCAGRWACSALHAPGAHAEDMSKPEELESARQTIFHFVAPPSLYPLMVPWYIDQVSGRDELKEATHAVRRVLVSHAIHGFLRYQVSSLA